MCVGGCSAMIVLSPVQVQATVACAVCFLQPATEEHIWFRDRRPVCYGDGFGPFCDDHCFWNVRLRCTLGGAHPTTRTSPARIPSFPAGSTLQCIEGFDPFDCEHDQLAYVDLGLVSHPLLLLRRHSDAACDRLLPLSGDWNRRWCQCDTRLPKRAQPPLDLTGFWGLAYTFNYKNLLYWRSWL